LNPNSNPTIVPLSCNSAANKDMLSEILNSIPLDHHMLQILNLVIANPLLKRIKKILNYLSNLQRIFHCWRGKIKSATDSKYKLKP
jgi:hypothetical protein